MQEGVASEACVARGPPAAGQARRPVRRQPDPARRPDGLGVQRGRARPVSTPTAGTPSASRTATTSAAISAAIDAAKADDRPSIIAVRTHIGYGSPNKQDTQKAHGAPLGPDEVRLVKEAYGWDPDRTFYVPDEAGRAVPAGGRRGQGPGRRVGVALRPLRRRVPGRGRGAGAAPAGPPARRLGRGAARVRGGHRGRDAQREPGRDPGAGRAAARAVRRLGGPLGVEPDRRQGERPRPLRGRPRGAQPAVRRPRARHGRDRQRHRLPRRLPPLLRDVPHLQRLHARRPSGWPRCRACT